MSIPIKPATGRTLAHFVECHGKYYYVDSIFEAYLPANRYQRYETAVFETELDPIDPTGDGFSVELGEEVYLQKFDTEKEMELFHTFIIDHLEDYLEEEKMKIELKPCPFCGGRAEVKEETNFTLWSSSSYVVCEKCGARQRGVEMAHEYSSNEKVAEAWNERTPGPGVHITATGVEIIPPIWHKFDPEDKSTWPKIAEPVLTKTRGFPGDYHVQKFKPIRDEGTENWFGSWGTVGPPRTVEAWMPIEPY